MKLLWGEKGLLLGLLGLSHSLAISANNFWKRQAIYEFQVKIDISEVKKDYVVILGHKHCR